MERMEKRGISQLRLKQITDIIKIPIQHSENVDGINLTVTELSLSETGVKHIL